MGTLKKISYIFERKQKMHLFILFWLILIGAFVELLGVSAILPFIDVVLEPSIIQTNDKYRYIYQLLNMESATQFILVITIGLIALYILKNIYVILMCSLQFRFTFNNQRRLASRLMSYYMKQEYEYHLNKNTADFQRNITNDIAMFSATVLNVIELIAEGFVCILLIGFLLLQDFSTTVIVALLVGIFAGGFYIIYKKLLVNWGTKYRLLNGQVIKWIQQSLGGIKEVKILNREDYFLGAFDRNYGNTMKYTRKQKLLGAIPRPIMETVCIAGLLLTIAIRLGMGADVKEFIPTLSVFAIAAFRMLPSFNRITTYLSVITFNKAAIDAVYSELKEADGYEKDRKVVNNSNSIEFNNTIAIENLKYKYPNTDTYVINDISFKIPKNKSVAFIGPSGSGKTTLVDLILGVLLPEEGRILSDGSNIHDNINSWFSHLGYIPQAIYLTDDTIRNNVAFGIKPNQIKEEQVWKALKEAQLDEFVKGLELGLDTEIGEKGVRLSGGQRQRIGIARTLYNNPNILVLDEATSALDTETEKAVMEAINNLMGVKTLIIIAHRLSTIENCDVVYEVKDGKILQIR